MITEIAISGFKSLVDFRMTFEKGLNVLIGPNGAGKSNICYALDLFAKAASGNIRTFLSERGGMTGCFTSTLGDNLSEKGICASCKGEIALSDSDEVLIYEYKIRLFIIGDTIPILNQELQLQKGSYKDNKFSIILEAKTETLKYKTIFPEARITISSIKIPTNDNDNILAMISSSSNEELLGGKFFRVLSDKFDYCRLVREDLKGTTILSIAPQVARERNDTIHPSEMLSDGKYLTNALYAMINGNNIDLDDLKSLLEKVYRRFKDIGSISSEDTTRSFYILEGDDIKTPAKNLSDGTVKVIALLVGIYSQKTGTTVIEELENYLHPWACQLLVEYFRDYFDDKVCILTTHSETVLNALRPEEVIVVENKSGKTECTRLSEDSNLKEVIRNTGVGCGYFYVGGSIGGVPL
ncbi:AAA family ATPase [Candidatus Magnetobacterium casense]|uniref:AAA family ATPase n=1 Tax=Candidatus Magnetobacterium casense TaxID=1455061 RepID=A0ABS6S0B3_9BACT|nr:AAA family ATPase [Candidatus Magnetobacterium casensis]MBV6342067.1 AAA family ATPase [Candidatus Magnetobacterium casensis]